MCLNIVRERLSQVFGKPLETFQDMSLDPDTIANYACDMGYEIHWNDLDEWEDLEDSAIIDILLDQIKLPSGDVLTVPDAVFFDEEKPEVVKAEDLKSYVNKYSLNHRGCFFNGDALILSMNAPVIILFHHEGVFGALQFNEQA